MLVSTRWLEYLKQLDQDETSKKDQPPVRIFLPVPGTQIVERGTKWRAEGKTREKKGKGARRKLSPP